MTQYPESEYCTFLFADGRGCRALKMPTRNVCIEHWRQDGQFDEDETAVAELAVVGGTLSTPAKVNRALASLWRLTAQNKIPHRKAALLAYIGNSLLCSLPRPRSKELPLPALPEPVQDALESATQFAAIKTGPNGPNGSGSGSSV